ncbi:hypothetical protein MKZ38_005663 [Zalerion maritima]|uniref:RIC1 C-terminal alpha solenoid region domain-containing protein n=1 Tax=Zalerion maritima TaxID=339359 RepID=A0AAD5RVY2_9PEZI|nr:hypothetical protein MKZ38_005663 [Zalerion maritima]
MYWPIGTPRVFATASAQAQQAQAPSGTHLSHDGADSSRTEADDPPPSGPPTRSSTFDIQNTPITPITPATPGIRSVEDEADDYLQHHSSHPHAHGLHNVPSLVPSCVPSTEPILGLRISRSGHLFATITKTSITIWQTKPTVILAVVVRSETSLSTYGTNVSLMLRPDSAILVVQTTGGYLITYSVAFDSDSNVYKAHFISHHNIQRRRQSHALNPSLPPDQIMWGAGEGNGVRDLSIRFRMVIKVDAGIQTTIALDEELIVATKKPSAVQCILWSPDQSGKQTSTEILSRMAWMEKKVSLVHMIHDRPMNLSTWITSDGKAYAVQRHSLPSSATSVSSTSSDSVEPERPKLFKGFCFHAPGSDIERATRSTINARFSLIAVGCADGRIHVYSAKDYSGNIPPSHTHTLPVSLSSSGSVTTLVYSPDGYCLFAGYELGWATFSVFGKLQSHSFGTGATPGTASPEGWLSGVSEAGWVGGACELLMIGRQLETIWLLEMARNSVTGCYNPTNVFRTMLQTTSGVMVYRGYDLPDLTTISAEPFLWHHAQIPPTYLMNQWPIRCSVISSDGRYVAVAGRRGLAHYSVNSSRWKTFADKAMENEFQVRGGMCWYQHILVAAVEANRTFELRLYSRESNLDQSHIVHTQQLPAPVVLITQSGEDSLLVYTYENLLYHFIFAPGNNTVNLVQVGQIAFHGIVRSPARVRGLSWILPESQLTDGDPSQDVAVASVLFLVDGKLVLLQPSLNHEGHLKYDMKVIAQSVEFYASMKDQPFVASDTSLDGDVQHLPSEIWGKSLKRSLWMLDGGELKVWPDFQGVTNSTSSDANRDVPPTVSIPIDFYPLSILLNKALVLGVEADLIQRRDVNFAFFRFAIRTHLFLPEVLRFHLTLSNGAEALSLARHYQSLEYFSHALEILLHHVLDDEVDTAPKPDEAVLPRVLSLLSSFRDYLDIVVQCTRKTEVRSWRTLFAYLPPPQELFEESLLRGSLKTAGGYLLILHTFEELETASEQSVRLLARAMREEDWDLCKELARFLAALDETGETLRTAMDLVNSDAVTDNSDATQLAARLQIPPSRKNGSGTLSSGSLVGESDGQSSDTSSIGSASRSDSR